MYISQLCKTGLLTTSCALLLLSGASLSHAQTADSIDYLYVSPQGNDSWSGQSPTPTGDGGPFLTLSHAQEAVSALTDSGLTQPVEVTIDPSICGPKDFVSRWFTMSPNCPVIWHSDPNRTVLIYTPTLAEQNDALSAEDYTTASGSATARFYVSQGGSDAWSGHSPSEDGDNGPFLTLDRAQEAVNAFQTENPAAPVEVVVEQSLAAGANHLNAAGGKLEAGIGKQALAAHAARKSQSEALKASALTKAGLSGKVAAPAHYVFAHYVVCNRDYGGSVAGYERDIQEAQAAGVDGFALNCGDWDGGNYKKDVASLFQAAQTLNTGFKLFFSLDFSNGLTPAEVQSMVKAYAGNPSYFVYNSRPVLSTWGGETMVSADAHTPQAFWTNDILTPLRKAGYNMYFVPMFFTRNGSTLMETPTSAPIMGANAALWKNIVDGVFMVSCLGLTTDTALPNVGPAETYAPLAKGAGHTMMSSVSPQYWGDKQTDCGRRYFEYAGGEGIEKQWKSILTVQHSDWVELFTWNDFDEATYFSPIDDVAKYWPYTQHTTLGFYKSHAGALKLNQYYVNWFKAGVQPAITNDSLFCFYRTQPKAAAASADKLGKVTWTYGSVQDTLYVTTLLTAPATLMVTTGTKTQSFAVAAGVSNTRIPFQTGAQSFQLVRNGKTIVSQAGEPIVASPKEYNYNYYTGYAAD